MAKVETDRRSGMERRGYHYTIHIPERRIGKDRRIAKNGKEVHREKSTDKVHKGAHRDLFQEK
jgi:hypothetical protein